MKHRQAKRRACEFKPGIEAGGIVIEFRPLRFFECASVDIFIQPQKRRKCQKGSLNHQGVESPKICSWQWRSLCSGHRILGRLNRRNQIRRNNLSGRQALRGSWVFAEISFRSLFLGWVVAVALSRRFQFLVWLSCPANFMTVKNLKAFSHWLSEPSAYCQIASNSS